MPDEVEGLCEVLQVTLEGNWPEVSDLSWHSRPIEAEGWEVSQVDIRRLGEACPEKLMNLGKTPHFGI